MAGVPEFTVEASSRAYACTLTRPPTPTPTYPRARGTPNGVMRRPPRRRASAQAERVQRLGISGLPRSHPKELLDPRELDPRPSMGLAEGLLMTIDL